MVEAEGVEPSSRSYKEHALTLELRAVVSVSVVSGAEGSRTLTVPLKRRERYRYATTPSVEWAYAFKPRGHVVSPGSERAVSGSPENRTQQTFGFGDQTAYPRATPE